MDKLLDKLTLALIEVQMQLHKEGVDARDVPYTMLAQAAISTMPSIKWQKIETLPDSYKTDGKAFLAWTTSGYARKISYQRDDYYKRIMTEDRCYIDPSWLTHWAEINAPEDE